MKRYILTVFLLLIYVICFSQVELISGRKFDRQGEPLERASVYQEKESVFSATDMNGAFHICIRKNPENSISIACNDYYPAVIGEFDTIGSPLVIYLDEDKRAVKTEKSPDIPDIFHPHKSNRFGIISSFQIDFAKNDFSVFDSLLGSYNTELMNSAIGTAGLELSGTYKKYRSGINFGYSFNSNYKHDSLDIEFNSFQYGLHFGYILVSSHRFLITPEMSLKWNRYRLINNIKEKKIPIEQYVSERDLDMRFNQTTGFVGLNVAYKMYDLTSSASIYWTLGIYGGYLFKLNQDPWVHSMRNRLTTEKTIDIVNYSFGFFVSINFDEN